MKFSTNSVKGSNSYQKFHFDRSAEYWKEWKEYWKVFKNRAAPTRNGLTKHVIKFKYLGN